MVVVLICTALSQGVSPSHTLRLPAPTAGKLPVSVSCVPPSVDPLLGVTAASTGVRLESKVNVMSRATCAAPPCKQPERYTKECHILQHPCVQTLLWTHETLCSRTCEAFSISGYGTPADMLPCKPEVMHVMVVGVAATSLHVLWLNATCTPWVEKPAATRQRDKLVPGYTDTCKHVCGALLSQEL